MDVTKTRELNLCVSCEICNAVCPVDAIQMEFKEGQFLPDVDQNKCIDCEKCIEVCLGLDITIFDHENLTDKITGPYIEGYSAYTKDQDILKNSTSGGAITQLIIELLKEKEYDGAFVLPFDMFDGNQARLCLAETEEEVRKASKSKYLPASDYNVVERLESEEKPNYLIVGTPCQLSGIKNFIDLKEIDDEELLFLGLFCEKTLNFNFLDFIEEKHGKKGEKLVKFDYKNKEKDGWPGHPKLYFDSGREEIIDRQERMQVKEFFQLERCLYCLDKLNRQADISFGDCYIAGKENPGRSSIIIRTEKGKDVWEKYKDSFNWDKSSIKSIKKSQKIPEKKENLEFAKILVNNDDFFDKGINKTNQNKNKKLKMRRKKISIGKNRRYDDIEDSLTKNLDEIIKSKVGNIIGLTKKGLSLSTFFIKDTFSNTKYIDGRNNKNIIIFGGELFNKGAQAMTFTVVDQMKRRYPDKDIYLFSRDFERDLEEKKIYNFNILPFKDEIGLNILNKIPGFEAETQYIHLEKNIKNIFKNSAAFIDVSGYHLSSQMTPEAIWGIKKPFRYLLRIMLAKKFSKPYFILPQSIGPFNFRSIHKALLFPLMKRYLKYPKKIYPRENQGLKSLKPFTKRNVERKRDIVLLNNGYQLNNIFKREIELKKLNLQSNSVGIIPNNQVMKRGDKSEIYGFYRKIIETLRDANKTVYILRHSQEDLYICEGIKELFENDEKVLLVTKDLNAIELENIIGQFDYIVGSRYHSIINAYKNAIPAIVIGWAIKYKELVKDFEQSEYMLDIRGGIQEETLSDLLLKMEKNFRKEQKVIQSTLDGITKNQVFEEIEQILRFK